MANFRRSRRSHALGRSRLADQRNCFGLYTNRSTNFELRLWQWSLDLNRYSQRPRTYRAPRHGRCSRRPVAACQVAQSSDTIALGALQHAAARPAGIEAVPEVRAVGYVHRQRHLPHDAHRRRGAGDPRRAHAQAVLRAHQPAHKQAGAGMRESKAVHASMREFYRRIMRARLARFTFALNGNDFPRGVPLMQPANRIESFQQLLQNKIVQTLEDDGTQTAFANWWKGPRARGECAARSSQLSDWQEGHGEGTAGDQDRQARLPR